MGSQELPFSMLPALWDQYLKYRPPYPQSMFHEWLEFHQGPLNTFHDLGAGCGIAASCLIHASEERGNKVQTVYLSDPGATNLDVAAKALDKALYPGINFNFKQAKGEHEFLETGSVDMVIACESLHWTDVPVATKNIYNSLRPGGTFAAVLYHVYPTIRNSPRTERAFQRAIKEHYVRCAREDLLDGNWRKGHLHAARGLDFIGLSSDEWEDVRRFYINTKDYGNNWPWPHTVELLGSKPQSRVDLASGCETQYFHEKWEDWQMTTCTVTWLKESMISLHSAFDDLTFSSEAWKELEAAAADEGGFLHVTFPVTVVLARKRGP